MRKKAFHLNKFRIRLLYWISVVFLMVFIACPMFFFFYLFNEDQVKQMLYTEFDNNNYHVEVNGAIIPRFWHGLSLEVNDLAVATNNNSELMHIKTANCQLSWVDLVFARYKIKRLDLNDVNINENNIRKYGLSNLLTIPDSGSSAFSRLDNVSIFGINSNDKNAPYPIKDGLFTIQHTSSGAVYKLGFEMGESTTFVTSTGVMDAISSDVIKFRNFKVNVYNTNMQMKFSADTSYHVLEKQLILDNSSGSLDVANHKGQFSIAKTIFSPDGANFNNLSLAFNNLFTNQSVNFNLSNLSMPNYKSYSLGEGRISYLMNIQQNNIQLDSTLKQLKINATGIVSKDCRNKLNYERPDMADNKFNAVLSGVCQYDFKKYLFNVNASGVLNAAPLKLELSVDNKSDKPKILINGAVDNLDLSPFNVASSKLLPFYYDDSLLPFAWFSSLNIAGKLNIGHFSLDRIHLNDVNTEFKLQDDTLNIDKLHANIYDGSLFGSAKISKESNGYNISTKQTINNLDLKTMFQDLFDVGAISGKANLKIDAVTSHANSYVDLHKNLNGTITIDAKDGAFQGVDFNIFAASHSLNINKSTIFQKLNAQFNFIDGVSKLGNVVFYSPYLIASGSGVIDVVNTQLDYMLTIKSNLPPNKQEIKSVVIPVSAKGDLFDPQISIQNIHLSTGSNKVLRNHVPKSRLNKNNKTFRKEKK
jgi:hypothetical protein